MGNPEYTKANGSFGLTTLRDRHVRVRGSKLQFHFRGKSGQEHGVELEERRLARVVKQCRDLPGYELFQYVTDEGRRASIGSLDVNDYLREITGQDFTAKDFRTWAGTVLAVEALGKCHRCESETQAKKNVIEAVKSVADRLGNRPATCREYYVHPNVIDVYMKGSLGQKHCWAGSRLRKQEAQAVSVIRKREKRLARR